MENEIYWKDVGSRRVEEVTVSVRTRYDGKTSKVLISFSSKIYKSDNFFLDVIIFSLPIQLNELY